MIEGVLDGDRGRDDPLRLDAAGDAHQGVGIARACRRLHVEGNQELAVADAALTPEDGAGPGRQHQRRALGLAAPGQPIGVADEQRPPEVRFGEAGARRRARRGGGEPRRQVLDLARHLVHVRRQGRPRVQRPQEVARRRLAAGRRQLALREDRAGPRRIAGAARLDQDAGQPRRQRQGLHPPAERRQCAAVERAEALQQPAGGGHGLRRRRLEPRERVGIGPPRRQIEQRSGQIDARDVRLAMGTQPVARVPQPAGPSRTEAGGATGPLVGAGLGHALGVQRVEGPRRIVAGDLVQPGVHDRVDAGHGERRLGDVGGEDHAPAPA